MLRGVQGLDFGASNNAGSRELQTLPITSGMLQGILPPIPNLQFGYFYNFGNDIRSGRATVDYIRPFNLSSNSVVFGEGHAEFSDFWKTFRSSVNNRVDLSLGGGYRRMVGNSTLLGINGFYDTARLGSRWYNSGGVGFQMAAELPGNDAIDLNFNWYGKLFQRSVIVDAFRNGPRNYDFQAGYSHELWNGGPDFRLSATGYRFDAGEAVYGTNAAAELKSRDGMFTLKYAVGNDKLNKTYHTVGATVNMGFAPEKLLSLESPFSMPEPIFKSPRNLWAWLFQNVGANRNFSQVSSAILAQQAQGANNGSSSGTGGCSTDRFLADAGMAPWPGHPNHYIINPAGAVAGNAGVAFTAVPYTCLDPAKHIVVEFDYVFTAGGGPFANYTINVGVMDKAGIPGARTNGGAAFPNFGPGHLVVSIFVTDQSPFTTPGLDPSFLHMHVAGGAGTTALSITNVQIHFNQ
jgi:hypothetical protein